MGKNKQQKKQPQQMQMQMPMMFPMMQPPPPADDDDDAESEESTAAMAKKHTKKYLIAQRSKIEGTFLSRSFKTWGGGDRPISRTVKLQILVEVIPSLDLNLLSNISTYQLDQLYYVYFRVRPDTALASVGLTNKTAADAAEILKKSLDRVTRKNGGIESMMGINEDMTNIDEIAVQMGWQKDCICIIAVG